MRVPSPFDGDAWLLSIDRKLAELATRVTDIQLVRLTLPASMIDREVFLATTHAFSLTEAIASWQSMTEFDLPEDLFPPERMLVLIIENVTLAARTETEKFLLVLCTLTNRFAALRLSGRKAKIILVN